MSSAINPQVSLSPVAGSAVEVSAGLWFHMHAGARVIRVFVSNEALEGVGEPAMSRRERFDLHRTVFESAAGERYAAGMVEPDGIIRL